MLYAECFYAILYITIHTSSLFTSTIDILLRCHIQNECLMENKEKRLVKNDIATWAYGKKVYQLCYFLKSSLYFTLKFVFCALSF